MKKTESAAKGATPAPKDDGGGKGDTNDAKDVTPASPEKKPGKISGFFRRVFSKKKQPEGQQAPPSSTSTTAAAKPVENKPIFGRGTSWRRHRGHQYAQGSDVPDIGSLNIFGGDDIALFSPSASKSSLGGTFPRQSASKSGVRGTISRMSTRGASVTGQPAIVSTAKLKWLSKRKKREDDLAKCSGQLDNPYAMNLRADYKHLDETARSMNRRLFDVEGIGDCFYHSVFAALFMQDAAYTKEGRPLRDGFDLKNVVMDHLQLPWVKEEIMYVVEAVENMPYNKWISRLMTTAAWPDEYVVLQTAKCLQITIKVSYHLPTYTMSTYTPGDGKVSLAEAYIGNKVSMHFVAMVERYPVSAPAAGQPAKPK